MPRCAACNTTISHAAAAIAASPLRCQNSRSNSRSGSWACAKRVITTGSAISIIIRRFPMIQELAGHQIDGEEADDNHLLGRMGNKSEGDCSVSWCAKTTRYQASRLVSLVP